MTPIGTRTNTAGPPIHAGRGRTGGISITPDGQTAYVANFDSGTVTPIRTRTNTPGRRSTSVDPQAPAITPTARPATSRNGSDTVTPIRTRTNTAGRRSTPGTAR